LNPFFGSFQASVQGGHGLRQVTRLVAIEDPGEIGRGDAVAGVADGDGDDGVNGSRRWCLNCSAEWPTAVAFLAEVQAKHPPELATSREAIKTRLRKLVSLVDACPDEQLEEIVTWLDNLETALAPAPECAR
jgi:hypothetical protein